MSVDSLIHIVLIEPEIPQNTGNIGRTCVGLGATLHLVGPLGFSIEEKDLKRAGLDYWPSLKLETHPSWENFLSGFSAPVQFSFFSTKGRVPLWRRTFKTPSVLVFGSESRGFPKYIRERYADQLFRIPTTPDIRSLNLATAVGIAAYEAARQLKLFDNDV